MLACEMDILPEELWLLILNLVDESTRRILAHTSKSIKKLILKNSLEYSTMIRVGIDASMAGNLEILKWCTSNGYCPGVVDSRIATKNNHLHILKWMNENKYGISNYICYIAYITNHSNILEWCKYNLCTCDGKYH